MRAPVHLLLVVLGLSCIACGPTVDLTRGLQLIDVSTGWVDTGIVNGQNKLVPSISFKLKNVSDQKLSALQVNVVFKRQGETEEWGSAFMIVTKSEPLKAGETTGELLAKSSNGYTGSEPRLDMMKNSLFVDAKAEVSAKYGSTYLTRIGDFPVERRLIAK